MNLTLDPDSLPSGLLNRLHHCNIIMLACRLDFPSLVAEVQTLTAHWMAGAEPRVTPDLKATVYCTAVANGDSKVWHYFWTLYLRSKAATERVLILRALGCSRDITILTRYVRWGKCGLRKWSLKSICWKSEDIYCPSVFLVSMKLLASWSPRSQLGAKVSRASVSEESSSLHTLWGPSPGVVAEGMRLVSCPLKPKPLVFRLSWRGLSEALWTFHVSLLLVTFLNQLDFHNNSNQRYKVDYVWPVMFFFFRYLNMIMDENSEIRKQDGAIVFNAIAHNKNGYRLAFDFLAKRWHDIQE